jgi:hypothetical protein
MDLLTALANFCWRVDKIFKDHPNCKGVVGWYTQDEAFQTKCHMMCIPSIKDLEDDNHHNSDLSFIKENLYPLIKRLNIKCDESGTFPIFSL